MTSAILSNPYTAILQAIWGIIIKVAQSTGNTLGIRRLISLNYLKSQHYEYNINGGAGNPLQLLLHPEERGCSVSKEFTRILKSAYGYTSHIDDGTGKPLCGSHRSKKWIHREGSPSCRFCERMAETGTKVLYYAAFARKPKQGQVYLIHAVGLSRYKIGCTTISVDKRLLVLQNFSPVALEVLAAIDCSDIEKAEAWLHKKFASCRRHSEWFDLSDSDVQWIISQTSLEGVGND